MFCCSRPPIVADGGSQLLTVRFSHLTLNLLDRWSLVDLRRLFCRERLLLVGRSVQESCFRWLWHFRWTNRLWVAFLRLQLLPSERVEIRLVVERLRMLRVYGCWKRLSDLWLFSHNFVLPFAPDLIILLFLLLLLHFLTSFSYAVVFNVYVRTTWWLCARPAILFWLGLVEYLIDQLILEPNLVLCFTHHINLD